VARAPESEVVCFELLKLASRHGPSPGLPPLADRSRAAARGLDELLRGAHPAEARVFEALNKYSNDPWWVDPLTRAPSGERSRTAMERSGSSGFDPNGGASAGGPGILEARAGWPVQKLTLEKLETLTTAEGGKPSGAAPRRSPVLRGKPTGIIADWGGSSCSPPGRGEENRYAALLRQALGIGFQDPPEPLLQRRGRRPRSADPASSAAPRGVAAFPESMFSKAVASVLEKVRAGETRKNVLVRF